MRGWLRLVNVSMQTLDVVRVAHSVLRTTPAVVFFPQGYVPFKVVLALIDCCPPHYSTYRVSSPIIAYYYTVLVGDAKVSPTLLAASNFSGIAVIGTLSIGSRPVLCSSPACQMPTLTFPTGTGHSGM